MTYNKDRRRAVISLLSENGSRAFSTEEICSIILKDGGGKSTVYRIISELVHDGVVKKISDDKSRRVLYQYLGEKKCAEHLHLKCKVCGELIHLDRQTSRLIASSLVGSTLFTIDPSEILLGICKNCV